jgi:hypothetical protein
MSMTNQSYDSTPACWRFNVEWTITAAGAVVPNADGTTTTDPQVGVARTGAGTYLVTFPGNFQKVAGMQPTYRDATARSIVVNVTAVGLGTGTPMATGESTTTVTVVTGNTNAAPTAADQAQGIIGLRVAFQKNKV